MLMIFLFNVGGYYILLVGLEHHADQSLQKQLDAELYDEDELIELTIPMNLPYPVEEQSFQRMNGKFEHQGEHYKLVKQRFENNILYILCIKDHQHKKLVKSVHDYVKMVNDTPSSSKKTLSFFGKLVKDFEQSESDKLIHYYGWAAKISFNQPIFSLLSSAERVPAPPPKI
jgi:hypothetical protein